MNAWEMFERCSLNQWRGYPESAKRDRLAGWQQHMACHLASDVCGKVGWEKRDTLWTRLDDTGTLDLICIKTQVYQ